MAETLVVELDARTAKLEKALISVNNKLDKTEKNTAKADKSLKRMSSVAGVAGAALTKTAVAGLALATALTAVVLKSAASQQELSLLSRQAKLSTDDFEALAFATKQYGVNAEQIADISKDLSDKMGEFSKVGTGAFQDFADIAGLTKDEAKAMAREFENMSSDQVIGEMVRQMEEAGASSNQMTFALESMGNDLSRLIPLFTDGSKELKTLTSTYNDATKAMQLTSGEIKDLTEAATSFDLMTDSIGKAATKISSTLAPTLNSFFASVTKYVPDATQKIVDFINTFRDAEQIQSIKDIDAQITLAEENITSLTETQDKWANSTSNMKRAQNTAKNNVALLNVEIKEQEERVKALTEQKKLLQEQDKLADADRSGGGGITATGDSGGDGGTGDEIQAIVDRFKTEEELLAEKYNREKEMLGEALAEKLGLHQEYQNNLKAIQDQANAEAMEQGEELRGLFEDNQADELKDAESKNKDKEKSDHAYFSAANVIGNALFEDSKLVSSALAAMNTYEGVTKALSQQNWVAAAATAVAGAAQIANINSTEKGSSGGGSVGGGLTSAPVAEPTSSVTVSDTDVSGASQSQVIVATADDIAIALNELMNGAKVSGVIS